MLTVSLTSWILSIVLFFFILKNVSEAGLLSLSLCKKSTQLGSIDRDSPCLIPKTPWPLVRKRTILTDRPPLVGEVSANFCG
jgi:hypothetical protein